MPTLFCSFAEDYAQLAPAAALSSAALTWIHTELSQHGCSGPTRVWLGRYTLPSTTIATTAQNGPPPCPASQRGLDAATLATSEGQCLATALVVDLDLDPNVDGAKAACWAAFPCDALPDAAAPFLCSAPSASAVQQMGKGVNLTDLVSQTQMTGQVGITQLLAQSPPPPSIAAGQPAAGDGATGAEADCDMSKEEGCGWKAGEPFLGFYAMFGGNVLVGGPPPPRAPPRSLAAPPAKANKFAGWNLVIIIAVSAGGAVLLAAIVALTVVFWPRGDKGQAAGAKAAEAAGADDPAGTRSASAAEEGSPSSSTPETSSPHSSILGLRPAPPRASLPGSPRNRGHRVRTPSNAPLATAALPRSPSRGPVLVPTANGFALEERLGLAQDEVLVQAPGHPHLEPADNQAGPNGSSLGGGSRREGLQGSRASTRPHASPGAPARHSQARAATGSSAALGTNPTVTMPARSGTWASPQQAEDAGAGTDVHLPPRTWDQQHVPPSPPSSSSASASSPGPHRQHSSGADRHTRSHTRSRTGTPGRPLHGGAGGTATARDSSSTSTSQYSASGREPHSDLNHSRHGPLLAKVAACTNWYELRVLLLSSASASGAVMADDVGAEVVLSVLRRLGDVARYDMRPAEAADLGAFLSRWLLQHSAALGGMGPYELTSCMRSLAKLARALPEPPGPWVMAWFAAAQPYLSAGRFRPKDLTLSVWAFSRLQLRLPQAAIQRLLAAAEPHLHAFNAQDLSLLALALSTLQQRLDSSEQSSSARAPAAAAAAASPRAAAAASASGAGGGGGPPLAAQRALPPCLIPSSAWRDQLLARCGEVVPSGSANAQALANLLHGLVRTRGLDPPDWLLSDICTALYGHLPDCNPQGLANVLSALAARRFLPDEGWVERFLTESAARMAGAGASASASAAAAEDGADGGEEGAAGGASAGGSSSARGWRPGRAGGGVGLCNADDLAHLAAAAAALELAPPRWWTARLHAAMEAAMPRASARQLAQMLQGAAALYRSSVGASAGPGSGAATAGSGTAGPVRPPRSLLLAWHSAADAALPSFNTLDAAHSLWALAVLGERPPAAWLQRLLVLARPSLASTPPPELALLLWSLGALGFRPTWAWLADAVDAAEPNLQRMGPQDLAMLTSALVRLGGRTGAGWAAAVLAAVRPWLGTMPMRPLAQTAWALRRLRVQPPPEWLAGATETAAERWRGEAAEAGAAAGVAEEVEEEARGAGGRAARLRPMTTLLWVLSRWLGPERPLRRSRRSRLAASTAAFRLAAMPPPPPAVAKQPAPGLEPAPQTQADLGSGTGQPAAVAAAAPAAVRSPSASTSSCDDVSLQAPPLRPQPRVPTPPADSDAGARPALFQPPARPAPGLGSPPQEHAQLDGPQGSDPATAPARRPRLCRVTARMLRRRKAARPGSLVASLGDDALAAAKLRRRLAAPLLAAAMDATAPLLPAATAQDLALMLAAAASLRGSATSAAAARPRWVRAVLAASEAQLASGHVTAHGLCLVARGLAAMRVAVGPSWAAAAAAAAAHHLAGPMPAAEKVTLLRRLYALRVAESDAAAGVQTSAAASAAGAAPRRRWRGPPARRVWGALLASTLEGMRWGSGAAEALLRAQVEVLKARVRLRRIANALAEARPSSRSGAAAAAIAAAERRAEAVATLAAAAAAAGPGAGGAPSVAVATEELRAFVAAAAQATAAAAMAAAEADPDAEENAAAQRRPVWRRRARVPPVPEAQRAWVWARARRTLASQLGDASPQVVVQLAELLAQHLTEAAEPPPPSPSAATALGGAALGAGPGAGPEPVEVAGNASGAGRVRLQSVLWLAERTETAWRRLDSRGRAKAARAWRQIVAALEGAGPAGGAARAEVEARLPQRRWAEAGRGRGRGRARQEKKL
ncbi:hypothetical protein HYH03_004248 [Edaphochlamys debaryana]|uniref:Uncharacterized protein n=1 Tax=Edaphochlamys debaryana TaxID=47281 RepID=A0A835YHZ3_9CHLO|nr:hypothetical protein HYH03_004248 [Edaphochlamys debaryana]|eukprot:KAG2497989.1 hypothetical protein HYH03_004248 [Edaphochlamys debaryana]